MATIRLKACYICSSSTFKQIVIEGNGSGLTMVAGLCVKCLESLTAGDGNTVTFEIRVKRTEFVRHLALLDGLKAESDSYD